MNLQEQGFRFVLRGVAGAWMHPEEMRPGDLDCTDMSDEEFEDALDLAIGRKQKDTSWIKTKP